MATLVFSALGTALGGPLGGAIGALAGRQFDAALFGAPARSGPRLRELELTLSSYGQPIPRIHGRMRVPGAVIWATELQESSEVQGGKGQPATTTYSYAANLAIAVASRPILGIGRIWADGKLLRGAGGDLKTGGTLRIYTGAEDQPVDPLIAAAEGEGHAPAFRGLAYVVFEGLELADFGNRLPALTFEVIADDAVRLGDIVGEGLSGAAATGDLGSMTGLVVEDSLADTLATLAPVFPVAIDAAGEAIRVGISGRDVQPTALDAAAVAAQDDGAVPAGGAAFRRAPAEPAPPPVLRYFDTMRDYQPGTQHASGRAGIGQPPIVELPAAIAPAAARSLVEQLARQRDRARERLAWRTCTLDPAIGPGDRVTVPGQRGTWQVESWEWRESGVELELSRAPIGEIPAAPPAAAAFAAPADVAAATSRIVALELPWGGSTSAGANTAPAVALVGATPGNWRGAALYVDGGDGQLWPLGQASPRRASVGHAVTALAAASPLLLDRASGVVVELVDPNDALDSVGLPALLTGRNLALIGSELVQFAQAEPLGAGRWRLSGLLRGCGGTEAAIAGHLAGEPFALIDTRATDLISERPLQAGDTIAAMGRGDTEPARSPLHLAGIATRPLAPVHPHATRSPDGSLHLRWIRRARGAWTWADGVDVPLVEEAERYVVSWDADGASLRSWLTAEPELVLTPADAASMLIEPAGVLSVRQQGTYALSLPLLLPLPRAAPIPSPETHHG